MWGGADPRIQSWQDETNSRLVREALSLVISNGRHGIKYNQEIMFARGQRHSTITACQANIDELRKLQSELLEEASPSNLPKK